MPAKKNIIKELRAEIKALEDMLKGQRQHLTYRERQFNRMENTHLYEIQLLHTRTSNVAGILKYRFAKDLSWLALTDNPESKMRYVRDAIEMLYSIGAPIEEEVDDD